MRRSFNEGNAMVCSSQRLEQRRDPEKKDSWIVRPRLNSTYKLMDGSAREIPFIVQWVSGHRNRSMIDIRLIFE
jgi:hypothetical protein